MASTSRGRRLTEAHRLAQARLAAQTVRQMLSAWGLLSGKNLDATLARWFRVVLPIIGQQRMSSTQLAASYVSAFRAVEVGIAPYTPTLAKPVSAKTLVTSLTVTGPVAVKIAIARGEQLARAMNIGASLSSGAAMRHALNGGRQTLLESVRTDPNAQGWARVTSGRPCAFCAMLASRGAVYRKGTADFDSHDSCACTAEPVYERDTDLPAGSDRFRELWEQSDGTLENFRKIYESTLT